MSELTGLELRKALCEALGYHVEAVSYEFSKEPWFNLLRSDGKRVDNGGHVEPSSPWKDAPALESDPGVFWPDLGYHRKSGQWLSLQNRPRYKCSGQVFVLLRC